MKRAYEEGKKLVRGQSGIVVHRQGYKPRAVSNKQWKKERIGNSWRYVRVDCKRHFPSDVRACREQDDGEELNGMKERASQQIQTAKSFSLGHVQLRKLANATNGDGKCACYTRPKQKITPIEEQTAARRVEKRLKSVSCETEFRPESRGISVAVVAGYGKWRLTMVDAPQPKISFGRWIYTALSRPESRRQIKK